jgi:DNA-directed RNA polymerase specialized sigma24 family protein
MLRDAVGVTWAADPSEAELERFWAESGGHLLQAAVLLTGSRQAGEYLVQAALERVLPRWHAMDGDVEPCVRRTIYNLAARGRNGGGRWHARRAQHRGADDGIGPDGVVRTELVQLLLRLPPGQRAAIVLRYWEDLSESEAADMLGCSASAVRSAAAHGMRRLRRSYGAPRPSAGRGAGGGNHGPFGDDI